MSAHRDHVVGGGHLRHLRRAHGPHDGQGTADRLPRPEPAPCDRRHLHRLDRARTAGTERVGGDRHPVLHQANGFEAGRDGAGHHLDDRRAGRAVAAGPARRPPDAALDSPALAHVLRHRRRRDRRLPVVACDRRQLVGRRLHPRHGPRRRARRLHVELLPLVRQSRRPVRLVLQPAGIDDRRQRREHLDPAARPGMRNRVLALAFSRSAATAGTRGCGEQASGMGGRPCATGGLDAVQQRPAPRGPDRHRRTHHLRADRARDHVGPA